MDSRRKRRFTRWLGCQQLERRDLLSGDPALDHVARGLDTSGCARCGGDAQAIQAWEQAVSRSGGELRLSAAGLPIYFDPADHSAADHSAADHNAADHNAADHNAADHNAADHNAADHNAAGPNAADDGEGASSGAGGEKHPLTAIPILHSNPNASQKLYLDFDGEIVVESDWNVDNKGKPIHAVPYDIDGDLETFSDEELDRIHRIWQRVSEDFLPFELDVTTELPPKSALLGRRQAIRALISTNIDDANMGGTGDSWFATSGGVAFVTSWNWQGETPVWAFYNNVDSSTEKAVAEVVSHEFGHALGLSHDGTIGGNAYYSGHGTGETGWGPIMGAPYQTNVSQWSRGSYEAASNLEDDVGIITSSLNEVVFRIDDHGNSENDATALNVDGKLLTGSGIISTESDLDVFSFSHTGGPIYFDVTPASIGPNLDIVVEIYDDNRQLVDAYEPLQTLSVQIERELVAGTYYLLIDGGGFAPEGGEQGYDDYGSLGRYSINGEAGGRILTALAGEVYSIAEGTSLSLDASNTRSDVSVRPLGFAWDINGDGVFGDVIGEQVLVSWQQLVQFGIHDNGNYTLGLEVTDAETNTSRATATLQVRNLKPTAILEGPTTAKAGLLTLFEVIATDIENDPLSFSWTVNGEIVEATSEMLSFTFAEPGNYDVSATASDDDGGRTIVSLQVIVQPNLPRVISHSIHNGDIVSRPLSIEFAFDQNVAASLNPTDLLLFNKTLGIIVNPPVPAVTWDAATNTASFSLADLPRGDYSLVLIGDAIANAEGGQLDGDMDQVSGGNLSFDFTIAVRGDANLDGVVDFSDFLVLSANFGTAGNWRSGDFDGDGQVRFGDFLMLSGNFGFGV